MLLMNLRMNKGTRFYAHRPTTPELQPMETCWAVVKNQIARKSQCTMAHLLEQLDEAFDSVTEETC
jgi:hypothetical protein